MEGNAYNNILPTSPELVRSAEYGNEKVYALDTLKDLFVIWREQAENKKRSERSRQDAEKIVGRLAFEIVYRTNRDMLLFNFEEALDIKEKEDI